MISSTCIVLDINVKVLLRVRDDTHDPNVGGLRGCGGR